MTENVNKHQPAGAVVRFHRDKARLTRRTLSLLADVSETAIFDVESGKPTVRLSTVLRLLDALNVRMRFDSPLMEAFDTEAAG